METSPYLPALSTEDGNKYRVAFGSRHTMVELPRGEKFVQDQKGKKLHYLLREEIEELKASVTNPRDEMLIDFLFHVGCRISEATVVTKRDLDFNLSTVRIKCLKRKDDHINYPYVSRSFMGRLKYFVSSMNLEDEIFDFKSRNARRIIAKWGAVAGMPWIHPHVFRHSHAIHLLRARVPIVFIQAQLGHKTLETTRVYLQVLDTLRHAVLEEVPW